MHDGPTNLVSSLTAGMDGWRLVGRAYRRRVMLPLRTWTDSVLSRATPPTPAPALAPPRLSAHNPSDMRTCTWKNRSDDEVPPHFVVLNRQVAKFHTFVCHSTIGRRLGSVVLSGA